MAERPGLRPPSPRKPVPEPSARPWVLPAIVTVAIVVVVVGVIWASVLGHLF